MLLFSPLSKYIQRNGFNNKYKSVLWKVPVKDKVGNDNIDNLLIDHPTPQDAIHNVYELASTENCEIFTFHTGVSHQVHNSESYLE